MADGTEPGSENSSAGGVFAPKFFRPTQNEATRSTPAPTPSTTKPPPYIGAAVAIRLKGPGPSQRRRRRSSARLTTPAEALRRSSTAAAIRSACSEITSSVT